MRTTADAPDFDVLIVGAGLSGIGAACHLQRDCPELSFALLEARPRIGGTWDLFRYPGVRSDSDMHTLGYSFRPWTDAEAIAGGPAILRYIRQTAAEHGVLDHVRTHHRVIGAEWTSETGTWTVDVERGDGGGSGDWGHDGDGGDRVQLTCRFLLVCSGYYRYDRGYTPELPGIERFGGRVVHPQFWPADLDYTGRRVLVIGSGATAVTLVPAMAQQAAHVTMLQRSPSYIVSLPSRDGLAERLRRRLPEKLAYQAIRWKNVGLMTLSYQLSRRRPRLMKSIIRRGAERQLPPDFDLDTHLNPPYAPWDQRLCVIPDGDLFTAISSGRASVVTDRIETFTPGGVRLSGGGEIEADVVVTATGLALLALGGIELTVDGRAVSLPETVAYKGMMLSGVPNFAFTIGYTNASWTLKADLTAHYVCRVLRHMAAGGYDQCVPVADDPAIGRRPLIDLTSGYVQRSVRDFPAQGSKRPWRLHQNYALDLLDFKLGDVNDGALRFTRTQAAPEAVPQAAAA